MNYINCESEKEWLKTNLSEERYIHSLGTAEYSAFLAEKFGLDRDKAYFCGLIHDCAKCMPSHELKKMLLNSFDLCDGEIDNPKTLHAPAGVIVAKKEFGVEDKEILSAIRWHTLGKYDMTDFEKIIYLADKIEEKTRPVEWAKPLRDVLEEDNGLDKAILLSYKNTIKSLVDRNLHICMTTIKIYNKFLEEVQKS